VDADTGERPPPTINLPTESKNREKKLSGYLPGEEASHILAFIASFF